MDKNEEYFTLITRSDVSAYIIKRGFGYLLTNLKQHKECENCNKTGEYKCPICAKTHGMYLCGFEYKKKIDELTEEFFEMRSKRKTEGNIDYESKF